MLLKHGHPRHDMLEFRELLEEGAREVKRAAVLKRIPCVLPPLLLLVDHRWLVR
jgi:hypothetical protein